MKRHYFISDDLDDLEAVENELESKGVTTPQIHVLSNDDAGLEHHHLHQVEAVLKRDVVRSTEIGAVIGVGASAAVLALAYFSGITETVGWVPFIFLAIVVLGFCTWEGGMFGIQEPHHDFKRFQEILDQGKHVLFVDLDPDQESILQQVVNDHPRLKMAGEGAATPRWVVRGQDTFKKTMDSLP